MNLLTEIILVEGLLKLRTQYPGFVVPLAMFVVVVVVFRKFINFGMGYLPLAGLFHLF